MPKDTYDVLDLIALAGCAALFGGIMYGVFNW